MYGARDQERTADRVLLSQIGEFKEAHRIARWIEEAIQGCYEPTEIDKASRALSLELADLFMRTLAIANRHGGGFDVETFVINRYRDGCAKCRKRYCICPNYFANFDLFERETIAATRAVK